MSRTPTHDVSYFRAKLDRIAAERDALLSRLETQEATERDVAISAELVQQYIDTLEEIENTHVTGLYVPTDVMSIMEAV